ncbi:MAG TPA: DNA helicase UvrD [Chromatiales bacterium]|nr:DNA helicase UvrD [Chromatiales bacterium]
MDRTAQASDPQRNITVTASAGTGKTYLLVTRLLRLLLSDTPPETILAITFTRKAATEMQQRITERLHQLLTLSPEALNGVLKAIGITPDDAMRNKAQRLYEQLLRCEQPLRITTFHAFCQEILRRFPLEADVPPGFEILESSGLLEKRALDALFSDATQQPDGELAEMLAILMAHCGGISGTETALKQFIQHRSDWWAFTLDQPHPLAYASETLARQLKIGTVNHGEDADFLTPSLLQQCEEFSVLLSRHSNKGNDAHAALLNQVGDDSQPSQQRIAAISTVFLTEKGEPRKRKASAAQSRSMGVDGQARFLELHHTICEALMERQDQLNRHQLYRGSVAWYHVGVRLLHHYQTMKEEQRLLDFADLEWRAYQLLNHHNNAHWIQYKLDQRINHLLIDEFQDTNPTQWRLLLPLLQELASGEAERNRSVFLVGDSKQSIYRFRRADPRLFATAQRWLEQRLNAVTSPLDISWRSAPAIIEFVNLLFDRTPLGERLSNFQPHETHQQSLWGKVEMLPLLDPDSDTKAPPSATFRNPLEQPRIGSGDAWQHHYAEGNLIAMQINTMLNDGTAIKEQDEPRTLQLNDIIILLRSRTHLSAYEAALREHNIAYISNTKSTILDTLEAQDMVALLNTLISPHNNLALAQLLRSPLFNCNESGLIALASLTAQQRSHHHTHSWFTSLALIQNQLTHDDPLVRAYRLINQWQQYAGELPVHDLLDRIYHEGDLQQRYFAAFPAHLHPRVESNLTRFIELALEIDSGRYPSLPHFINRLKRLKEHAPDCIDEPASVNHTGAVRIMTIHAAKGLEAPVVFMADTARVTKSKRAHHAIVNWPSEQANPSHFFLCGTKRSIDRDTMKLLEADDLEESREDTNLLYVALTRARQYLIITGCTPKKGKELGWYGAMAEQVMERDAIQNNTGFEMSNGTVLKIELTEQPESIENKTAAAISPVSPAASTATALTARSLPIENHTIQPSRAFQEASHRHGLSTPPSDDEEDEQSIRGETIHRILELMTHHTAPGRAVVTQQIMEEQGVNVAAERVLKWVDEACSLVENPELGWLFDPAQFDAAHNEMAIHFSDERGNFAGIIDRLVIKDDVIVIVDYKTHRNINLRNAASYGARYREQMAIYQSGIEKIWPDKRVKKSLLFTHSALCYTL